MTSLTELAKQCKRYQARLEYSLSDEDSLDIQDYFDVYQDTQEKINCKVNATLHVLNGLENTEEYFLAQARHYSGIAKSLAAKKERLLNKMLATVSELDFKVEPHDFPSFKILPNKLEILIDDTFDAMRVPAQFRRAIKPSAIISKEVVRQYLERGQTLLFAKLSDIATYHARGWRLKDGGKE